MFCASLMELQFAHVALNLLLSAHALDMRAVEVKITNRNVFMIKLSKCALIRGT
jgi:hypothetical protein